MVPPEDPLDGVGGVAGRRGKAPLLSPLCWPPAVPMPSSGAFGGKHRGEIELEFFLTYHEKLFYSQGLLFYSSMEGCSAAQADSYCIL